MCGCGGVNTPPYLFMKGEMNMKNYKTSVAQALNESVYSRIEVVDYWLDRLVCDYTEACETSNMVEDFMMFFGSVRYLMNNFLGGITNEQVYHIAKDLIIREIRDRNNLATDKVLDSSIWDEYWDALNENIKSRIDDYTWYLHRVEKFKNITTGVG